MFSYFPLHQNNHMSIHHVFTKIYQKFSSLGSREVYGVFGSIQDPRCPPGLWLVDTLLTSVELITIVWAVTSWLATRCQKCSSSHNLLYLLDAIRNRRWLSSLLIDREMFDCLSRTIACEVSRPSRNVALVVLLKVRSPDPKVHVRYCHHLASIGDVVRKLLHFNLLLWK